MTGAGRRAALLDGTQQARVYRMITGKMPDQLRLAFYLWTRQSVVALVKREYGIELSLTTVGRATATGCAL